MLWGRKILLHLFRPGVITQKGNKEMPVYSVFVLDATPVSISVQGLRKWDTPGLWCHMQLVPQWIVNDTTAAPETF